MKDDRRRLHGKLIKLLQLIKANESQVKPIKSSGFGLIHFLSHPLLASTLSPRTDICSNVSNVAMFGEWPVIY